MIQAAAVSAELPYSIGIVKDLGVSAAPPASVPSAALGLPQSVLRSDHQAVAAALGQAAIESKRSASASDSALHTAETSPVAGALSAIALATNDAGPGFDGAAVESRTLPVRADEDLLGQALEISRMRDSSLLPLGLDEFMTEAGITDPIKRAMLVGSFHLSPLMDARVVHQAIADELVARGINRRAHALAVIDNFSLLPIPKKRAFVEDVVESILYVLDDTINFGRLDEVEGRAKKFGMSPVDLSAFLKDWKKLGENGYQAAKLALLELLQNGSSSLKNGVARAHRRSAGLSWWEWCSPAKIWDWATARSIRRPPLTKGAYKIELMENGSDFRLEEHPAYDTGQLQKYLGGTFSSMQARFLSQNLDLLSRSQMSWVKEQPFWKDMPAEVQGRLAERESRLASIELWADLLAYWQRQLKEMREAQQAYVTDEPVDLKILLVKVQVAFQRAQGDAKKMTDALSGMARHLGSADQLMIAREALKCTREASFSEDMLEAAMLQILSNVTPQEEPDSLQMVLAVLHESRRISYLSSRDTVFRAARDFVQNHRLSPESEKSIKDEILAQVSTNYEALWAGLALNNLGSSWQRARTLNEGEIMATIAYQKKRLEATAAQERIALPAALTSMVSPALEPAG